MERPLWMLVPWAVFALAAGIKFWQLTTLFRQNHLNAPTRTDQFRETLEKIWATDPNPGSPTHQP